MAGRDDDHRTVVLHSQDDTESFTYGLEQFSRKPALAKFNHPRGGPGARVLPGKRHRLT